jgi:hypothetical protein
METKETGPFETLGTIYQTMGLHIEGKDSSGQSGVPRNFFGGGVQKIQLRIEGRENGDLGAVAP